MKNTKKKISMKIATVAVVGVTFVLTYAFLTSQTKPDSNVFTPTPNIGLDISEPNWTEDANGDGHYGEEDAKNYTANQLIETDPKLTNTTTSAKHSDEYVSMELHYFIDDKEVTYSEFTKVAKVQYKDKDGNVVEGFKPAWEALTGSGVEHGDNDRFYYVGESVDLEILKKGDSTQTIFDYVKINPQLRLEKEDGSKNTITLTGVDGNEFVVDGMPNFKIEVKGYGVQAANITLEEARAELLNLMNAN